LITMVSVDAE